MDDIRKTMQVLAKSGPMVQRFGKVHMVTLPNKLSVLGDILSQNVDFTFVMQCVIGGLDPNHIVMITNDLAQAKETAEFLLSERDLVPESLKAFFEHKCPRCDKPVSIPGPCDSCDDT